MRRKKLDTVLSDYIVASANLSKEQLLTTTDEISKFLPDYRADRHITLKELDKFLISKYQAKLADWKDMDKCTRTKVKRYNKYCKTVYCISECRISEEDYYASYIIDRANCINPLQNKDDFFMICS